METKKPRFMKMLFTLCLVFALLFGVASAAQAADFTVSDAAGLMNAVTAINSAPAGSNHTVTLAANFSTNAGIAITRGNTAFVLNGKTCEIVNTAGTGLSVFDATVTVSGTGALAVTGSAIGLFVANGGTATVTNATVTGAGWDNYAVRAYNGGTAHVLKTVYAQGAESTGALANVDSGITVGSGTATGSVTASGRGLNAITDSEIVVYGNVLAGGIHAVMAEETGSSVTVHGGAASTGAASYGARAENGGEVRIGIDAQGVALGAYALGGGSRVEIGANATGTGSNGVGAAAYDGGGIAVGGSAQGVKRGASAGGAGSVVDIAGHAKATGGGIGAYAENHGTVLVGGSALSEGQHGVGICAEEDGYVHALNAVAGPDGIGASAYVGSVGTGLIAVDGAITAGGTARYIESGNWNVPGSTVQKNPADKTVPTTRLGYDTYSDAYGNTVWVGNGNPAVQATVNPGSLPAAGGVAEIVITGNNDLPNAILLTAFIGKTATAVTGQTAGSAGTQAATLTFPTNASATENVTYTVKASIGGKYWTELPVTVTVAKKAALSSHLCDAFTDIDGHWAEKSICYAVENGLFYGTSATKFSPETPMTRAMLVTVLHRLEGKPGFTGTNGFSDVKSGKWYTDAIVWANVNGIVTGYGGGRFGPDDQITRQQMATILHRYAGTKGYDLTGSANLAVYADAGKIGAWALTAMKWANAEGFITGRSATALAPEGTAKRAEVATILQRFIVWAGGI